MPTNTKHLLKINPLTLFSMPSQYSTIQQNFSEEFLGGGGRVFGFLLPFVLFFFFFPVFTNSLQFFLLPSLLSQLQLGLQPLYQNCFFSLNVYIFIVVECMSPGSHLTGTVGLTSNRRSTLFSWIHVCTLLPGHHPLLGSSLSPVFMSISRP